jgi:hypothetical protein
METDAMNNSKRIPALIKNILNEKCKNPRFGGKI